MAQATHHFNQLAQWLQDSSSSVLASKRFLRWRNFLQASQGWLLSWALLLVLLVWSWQLVLSIALGLAVLVWVYLARLGWWQLPKRVDWRRLWSQANRSLTIASISGILMMGSSYLAIGIWRETNRSWLATGVIVEGLLILAVLVLLLWQRFDRPVPLESDRLATPFLADWFTDLADPDPLKRLVAIRQLTHAFQKQAFQTQAAELPMTEAHLADCFRLMLNRETEPLVCSALLEGLNRLNGSQTQDSLRLEAGKTEGFSPELQGRSQVKAEIFSEL